MAAQQQKSSFPGRVMRLLRAPATLVFVGGVTVGVALVIFTNVMVHATGTNEFCAGACHSMKFPNEEYEQSLHYMNHSGVRATCADCHIPAEYPQKLIHKTLSGIRDSIAEARGVISTREKYEARRMEMAQREIARLKARDSAECRHCHGIDFMDLKRQSAYTARAHRQAVETNRTCVDCHRGVAHTYPEEEEEGSEKKDAEKS